MKVISLSLLNEIDTWSGRGLGSTAREGTEGIIKQVPHHTSLLKWAEWELGHQFEGAEGTKCISSLVKPKGAALWTGVTFAAECHRLPQTYGSAA